MRFIGTRGSNANRKRFRQRGRSRLYRCLERDVGHERGSKRQRGHARHDLRREAQFRILAAAHPSAGGAPAKEHCGEKWEDDGPLDGLMRRCVGGSEHHAHRADEGIQDDGSAAREEPEIAAKEQDAKRGGEEDENRGSHKRMGVRQSGGPRRLGLRSPPVNMRSNCFVAGFFGPDTHSVVNCGDEDLAVSDLFGLRSFNDRGEDGW